MLLMNLEFLGGLGLTSGSGVWSSRGAADMGLRRDDDGLVVLYVTRGSVMGVEGARLNAVLELLGEPPLHRGNLFGDLKGLIVIPKTYLRNFS